MKAKTERRIKLYSQISSELAQIKDRDLSQLLKKTKTRSGWGTNHLLKIAGQKVFAKKIPLTRLEFENSYDTKNSYGLPLYYNYGVGSAGFGAFRELITHIKTTNWVLEGATPNFPLMYHYRILPRATKPLPVDEKKHRLYMARWNDNRAIDRYVRERQRSEFEIAMFLEHIPQTLATWFPKNSDKTAQVTEEVYEALRFMNGNGILHFDLHHHNVLTDGETVFLADFGLALDNNFSLSAKEASFHEAHAQYDFAEFICTMGVMLNDELTKLKGRAKKQVFEAYHLTEDMNWVERLEKLLSDLHLLRRLGVIDFSRQYFELLERNRDTILLTGRFFSNLSRNTKKNTKFDSVGLKRALKKATIETR